MVQVKIAGQIHKEGDLILFAVAVGILIAERFQNRFPLGNGSWHFQIQFIEPILAENRAVHDA
ncbi:hypothetical protein D3C85_1106440 [compost metagenome]